MRRWTGAVLVVGIVSGCGSEDGPQPGQAGADPAASEVVALAYDPSGSRLLKAYPQSLHQSRDHGYSWTPVALPAAVLDGRIVAVQTAQSGEGGLYVAGRGFGVLRSTDNGHNWQSLNRGLPDTRVESFATHSATDETLFVGLVGKGLFRSDDRGTRWRPVDPVPGGSTRKLAHVVLTQPNHTGWVYALTADGVLRTMDCFCGWQETGRLPAGGATDLAVHPEKPESMYALAEDGIHVSQDGGLTWESLSTSPDAAVAVTVAPDRTLYVAFADGAIGRSMDGGATWRTATRVAVGNHGSGK